ncbi:hypothetical protein AYO38_00460 [bacterium SCGC AG-212-C10]|nr:hypothetical protein AYO38_00460 [bacterium SCGC AG-212-C10]
MVDAPDFPTVAVGIELLRKCLEQAFSAVGCPREESMLIADALIQAELCEVTTHGVFRVPGYLDGLASGRYRTGDHSRIQQTGPASILIDAQNALGYLPAMQALDGAIEVAHELGVGIGGVRNSNEFGRAAYYVEAAAAQGFIALIFGNTLPLLAGPGGTVATHGNNPFAFSAPGEDAPLFDAAWTPRSGGEVGRRRLLGLPLPLEWGYVDSDGQPTTDPAAAQLGVQTAIGGAKGFGISLLVDMLAGTLTGAASGPGVPRDNSEVGTFILVLSPRVLGDFGDAWPSYPSQFGSAAAAVRASGARWPGDRSRAARTANLDRGWVAVATAILERAVDSMTRVSPSAAEPLAVLLKG